MPTKTEFPLNRLLIMLFLCSEAIILLQNYDLSDTSSFSFNLLSLIVGSLICFISYIPIFVITKRTGVDFMTFVQKQTPAGIVFVSMFYAIYFVYTAEYFLLRYSDMFVKKLNQEANIYVVALITLLVCAYAAYKGANSITRCAIFLFAFSLVAYIVLFSGCISSLDFAHYDFSSHGNFNDFIKNSLYFVTPSFTVVIFGFTSGCAKKLRLRQIGTMIIFTALLFVGILFFTWFSLGDYGNNQEYLIFGLSKVSHLGVMSGLESLYLSICTISVFITISILLCCINKDMAESSRLKNILLFVLIIFVLFFCAENYNPIKEILINPIFLNIFNIIGAIVIPTTYLLIYGRKSYA